MAKKRTEHRRVVRLSTTDAAVPDGAAASVVDSRTTRRCSVRFFAMAPQPTRGGGAECPVDACPALHDPQPGAQVAGQVLYGPHHAIGADQVRHLVQLV